MKKVILLIVAALLLGAAVWSTPYIAAYQIRQAAAAGDVGKISEKVNFPILKENLKMKFMASVNERMDELKDNPFAGMAQMMMMSLVNSMVDLYISPAGLALMLDGRKPQADKNSKELAGQASNKTYDDSEFSYSYMSLNIFKISVANKKSPSDTFSFILNRDGIISWQLVDIDVPGLAK